MTGTELGFRKFTIKYKMNFHTRKQVKPGGRQFFPDLIRPACGKQGSTQ